MNNQEDKQATEYASKITDKMSEDDLTTEQVLYICGRVMCEVLINVVTELPDEDDELEFIRGYVDAVKSQALDIAIKEEYTDTRVKDV